ncbi:SUMF1/EgtB/PvdO family nonheme iron enzyme [Chitinispirillales bacterium ANBcel5]|uniref:formylglycine-generating enzyme family protein n=1 Tax=Cellulosispirillum alkaliphilum TaxID=3039283 RepID=UPI002A4F3137|nr:SUMF1/EgtB/PvdO family nonheme iron enzyme [Chitinispirillales bacterium ANBcel5]
MKHFSLLFSALVSLFISVSFCTIQAQLVTIPAGSFQIGSENGSSDERPVRSLRMDSFGMHATEVTYSMYQECVDQGRCTPAHYDDGNCLQWDGRQFNTVIVPQQFRGDDYPVICVTWQQARAFCHSLGMRLPTEAQWEYAARAGGNQQFANQLPGQGNCSPGNSKGPQRVGSCEPNRWGLYDMTGNVWEWTSDNYESDAYRNFSDANPTGPRAGLYKSVRGGGWYSEGMQLRITNRHWFSPTFAEASVGFRCVK